MEEYLKYLTLLFPVVGVGLLWGGLVYKRHLRQKASAFQRIQGVVTGFASRAATHASGGGTVYHPIVEYQVEGNVFSVQSNVGYGKPKEKEGSKLDVMYDPGAFPIRGSCERLDWCGICERNERFPSASLIE